MLFFNETPVGKVLNCFSKDQDCADELLADTIHITTVYFFVLATTVILVCVTLPYYTIVAVVLVVSFVIIYFIYAPAASVMKDAAGVGNARLFAHLNEALSGLLVIRAFEAEPRYKSDNLHHIDLSHRASFNLEQLQLWLSFRLDFISSIFVFVTAFFAVLFRTTVDASSIGLAISNSFQQLVFYSWVVRGLAEINSYIACMERLSLYANYTPEESAAHIPETCPKESWPQNGSVEIKDLFLRYSPKLPPVLKNVSVSINGGEKVGVVGRTGSGKTTLLMTLFRLNEPDAGSISIDGVDVLKMGLADLRSKIAIIPQEPVLFKGTIRSNLDPFGLHSDEELWEAVECAHLKKELEAMPHKLDTPVVENGSNFSLGEKQLFCLAVRYQSLY